MTMDHIEIRTLGIVGLGYIGLPTAAMFAASGLEVSGVDIDPAVRDAVNAGSAHIEEGDLDELVATVRLKPAMHSSSPCPLRSTTTRMSRTSAMSRPPRAAWRQ